MINNETIDKTCQLIKSTKGNKYEQFKKPKRIAFAYNYWTLNDEDIADLYYYLAQNKTEENEQSALTIGQFIDNQKIIPVRKFNKYFYNLNLETIESVIERIKHNGNWLSLYDIKQEFEPKESYNSPIFYSYMKNDGTTFNIDRQTASTILGILTEHEIPTAKSIVQASFPYYANDNMDQFIKTLKK